MDPHSSDWFLVPFIKNILDGPYSDGGSALLSGPRGYVATGKPGLRRRSEGSVQKQRSTSHGQTYASPRQRV